MCFIFFSQGPVAPLRTCTLDALWQMSTASLFCPNCAFCMFNHVTVCWPDYRRLNSLEKVRAGIRASWGIRSLNWFQLSLPSNDQSFSRTDGAVACMLEEGGGVFFWGGGTSIGLHAGQLQCDLKPLFNINHMVVPVVLSPHYIFSTWK